jgi:hypothetical protein
MKEVFSLATFALGVLCFVAFVTTAKPTANAIHAAPDYCRRDSSGMGDATCMSSQQCQAPSGRRGNLAPAEFCGRDTTTAKAPEAARTTRE